jgi:outer membrane lipoprotein LolB
MSRGVAARLLAALVLAAPLSGCFLSPEEVKPAAANTAQSQSAWDARRGALQQVQNFTLQGRLAETGLVSFGGDLSWMQTGRSFEARFYGPLGVGAVSISGMPGAMQVRTKDGTYETDDPAAFMQQQFGWSVPVDGLRYWVLGLPAPGKLDALQLDANGRIQSLQQNGFTLEYTQYQPVGALELPSRFAIHDAQRGFKVFIDQWVSVE